MSGINTISKTPIKPTILIGKMRRFTKKVGYLRFLYETDWGLKGI